MTPIDLVDRLVDFIRPVVADFVLDTNIPGVAQKAPQVLSGYLPEKKPGDKQDPPDIPHVIVRYLDDGEEDDNTMNVRIIAATYSKEEQNGWRDAVNVATRIKTELEKRPIIGPFSIQKVRRELPEEQPFPVWLCLLTVTVDAPKVQQEVDWDAT